jgi:hypothetical protein
LKDQLVDLIISCVRTVYQTARSKFKRSYFVDLADKVQIC